VEHVEKNIENIFCPHIDQNNCNCHLLQLAIKDALNRANEQILNFMKKINQIVTFFHVSNKYYGQLREKNGKLAILQPCVTRWSSQYHCLKRLLRHKKGHVSSIFPCRGRETLSNFLLSLQDSMISAINGVFVNARNEGVTKVPENITPKEKFLIHDILNLLLPVAALTDELQAHKVNSSLLLSGLITAIKGKYPSIFCLIGPSRDWELLVK
jgi:hypothetical protein